MMKGETVKRFLIRTLITAAAIFLVVKLMPPEWMTAKSPLTLIIAALLLGLLNSVLRPILIVLTLPFTVLTLGLFILVINGFILYLVHLIDPSFYILNFWVAVLASLLISIISSLIHWLIKDNANA